MTERDASDRERDPHDQQQGRIPPRDAADTTMNFGQGLIPSADMDAPSVGLSSEEHSAVAALPPTSALLIMQRGPSAGARFLLDAERTLAGRSPRADIFLDDVTVSRKHVEFVRADQGFVVRDVGSLNGTYVNRTRIEQATLRPGDEVQIGKFRMTFHPSPGRGEARHAAPDQGS